MKKIAVPHKNYNIFSNFMHRQIKLFAFAAILSILSGSLAKTSYAFEVSSKLNKKENNSFFSFFISKPRSYINIVGSSTVYPFTAIIAEKFGKKYKRFRTPTVESTGTGGGFKLFCSGINQKYPDFSNASRKIKKSEIEHCKKNNITNIQEIKIGYDGIVIANSKKSKPINLTKTQIFFALANKIPKNGKLVKNYITKWSQINPELPDKEIKIYGPPPTSGTRDAFVELVMEEYCANNYLFKKEYPEKTLRKKMCHIIRTDGHFVEAGENDNLILQKLINDKNAFGIFGYSFLQENENKIQSAKIDYVKPSFYTIVSQKYSISRPLFIYMKAEHLDIIPGMKEFAKTILSKDTLGKDGYLSQKGLIPLSDYELRLMRYKILKDL